MLAVLDLADEETHQDGAWDLEVHEAVPVVLRVLETETEPATETTDTIGIHMLFNSGV